MNKILTLEDWPDAMNAFSSGNVTPQLWAAYLRASAGKSLPPVDWATRGQIRAFVNHGWWLAMCPFCNAAQPATPRYPAFWCAECAMALNGGLPIVVIFPPERKQIEALLTARRDIHTRHWNPREKVEDLTEENKNHGIEVK